MGVDLGSDPHRPERVHVVSVRLDRSGQFFVVMSSGEECTWDQWCDWDCVDMRAATPDAHPGEAEGGRDAGPEGGGERNG